MRETSAECVPPIRWVNRWLIPAEGTPDWQRVSFQPMLYLCSWVAAIVIVARGDFTALPPRTSEPFIWSWGILALIAPPAALVSLWLIQNGRGYWKYRGLWTRLGADLAQGAAMMTYLIMRIGGHDAYLYPLSALLAATLFVFHLIMRDIRRLHQVEQLAIRIRDGDVTPPR